MANCKYLQILVTNLDGTMTSHTFKQNNLSIDCIINSTHKFLNDAGEILDSRKLTNIDKHKDYNELGTHMYVAQEINVGDPPSCGSLCCNPECLTFFNDNNMEDMNKACDNTYLDPESCFKLLYNVATDKGYLINNDRDGKVKASIPQSTDNTILGVASEKRRLITNGSWAYIKDVELAMI